MTMSKYDAIAKRLTEIGADQVIATFDEVEVWLGAELPPSARKHSPWWSGASACWKRLGWRAKPDVRHGRVVFERDQRVPSDSPRVSSKPRSDRVRVVAARVTDQNAPQQGWCGQNFTLVCALEPNRQEGKIIEVFPQERYRNDGGLSISKDGVGPFCRFVIPGNFQESGVYLITVDQEVKYVGEAVNLSKRYNMGYGNISPRNCYEGGQSTNCRINNLILCAARAEQSILLWFCPTTDYKRLEWEMIQSLQPVWNRKGM